MIAVTEKIHDPRRFLEFMLANTYPERYHQEIICELAEFQVFFDDTYKRNNINYLIYPGTGFGLRCNSRRNSLFGTFSKATLATSMGISWVCCREPKDTHVNPVFLSIPASRVLMSIRSNA